GREGGFLLRGVQAGRREALCPDDGCPGRRAARDDATAGILAWNAGGLLPRTGLVAGVVGGTAPASGDGAAGAWAGERAQGGGAGLATVAGEAVERGGGTIHQSCLSRIPSHQPLWQLAGTGCCFSFPERGAGVLCPETKGHQEQAQESQGATCAA